MAEKTGTTPRFVEREFAAHRLEGKRLAYKQEDGSMVCFDSVDVEEWRRQYGIWIEEAAAKESRRAVARLQLTLDL